MVLTTGKEIAVPKSRYPEVKGQYTLFKGAAGKVQIYHAPWDYLEGGEGRGG